MAAALAGCGVEGDGRELVDRRMPSQGYCTHYRQLLKVIEREGSIPRSALQRFAPLFEADTRRLRAVRDVDLADRARGIADSMRALVAEQLPPQQLDEHAQRVLRTLLDTPDYACAGEDAFAWQDDGRSWMELRLPAAWRVFAEDWRLPGGRVVGRSIRAGRGMVQAQDAFGWEPYRWLFPTAFLGVSRTLAKEMEVDEGRTAAALDRLHEWMDETPLPKGCRLVGTAPYEKGVMSGFMRRSENCGGLGSAMIEIFAVALHREPDAAVVLLRLTGRRTGDVATFREAVESFHVIH